MGAKRDAAAYADPDVITRYASMGPVLAAYADPDVITRYARDLVEEEGDARKANPEPTKAYANPGYEQPAYNDKLKRLRPQLMKMYQGSSRDSRSLLDKNEKKVEEGISGLNEADKEAIENDTSSEDESSRQARGF